MLPQESDATVKLGFRQRIGVARNQQQRLEHERSQRLARAKQAVRFAMPSTIVGLLTPEIIGGFRGSGPFTAHTTDLQRQQKNRAGVENAIHRRAGIGSRSTASSRIAALLTATRPVMQ
jgi:hypothetical protein